MFEEFKKAIPNLTIDESERLRIKNQKLEADKSELEKVREEMITWKASRARTEDEAERWKSTAQDLQRQIDELKSQIKK